MGGGGGGGGGGAEGEDSHIRQGLKLAHYVHSLHAKRLLGVPQNGFYE